MARPTIWELEEILEREKEIPIEILPNGEVREINQTSPRELQRHEFEITDRKPITLREDLGGEYGVGG